MTISQIHENIKETDSGELEAPENIIGNISAARAIHSKLRQSHSKRIYLYSLIQGLIGGNPPYDPVELAQHGLSHISNFSTLDGTSLYEKAGLAYWNLLNQTEYIAKFKLRLPPQAVASGETAKWQDIMAKNFDYVVRKWPAFKTEMNKLSAQLVLFGISPISWPDERDWQWETIELSKFFVEDMASTDIEDLTCCCMESYMTIQELFEIYDHLVDLEEKEAAKEQWNREELKSLLIHVAGGGDRTSGGWPDMLELKKSYQNGDLQSGTLFTDSVRIVTLLYKEYDGKITQYRFHRDHDRGDFLFMVSRQYERMEDALIIFTKDPGEFTIHGNKGIGHKIFSMTQAKNQLDCSLVDMAKWASTPIIKNPSAGYQEIDTIRFTPGVPTNIGSSEFVNNTLSTNMDNVIGVSQYMDGKLQFNLATSGDDPQVPDPDVGSKSPPEIRAMSYKEFGVLKNSIAQYYGYSDVLMATMFSRMWYGKKAYPNYKYVEEFKLRCLEDGLPEEIFKMNTSKEGAGLDGLPRHVEVKAARVAGDGSTLARIMGLEAIARILGGLGPKAQREYHRQHIRTHLGDDYVEPFMQDTESADETSGGSSLAAVENNSMEEGKGVVFSPDNVQRTHLTIHMALAKKLIEKRVKQELDPMEIDKVYTVLIPHLREHWGALAQSPFNEAFLSQIQGAFGQIMKDATANKKNAVAMMQKEMKDQEREQEKMQASKMEQQRKNMETTAEIQRKGAESQAKEQRAAEATRTRGQIMRQKAAEEIDIKREKMRREADIKKEAASKKSSPEQVLDKMIGETPSPYDIE